jgi:hypothetical protein
MDATLIASDAERSLIGFGARTMQPTLRGWRPQARLIAAYEERK